MKTRRVLLFVSAACIVAACGSRTGLLVPIKEDAGLDATEEPGVDAPFETGFDASEEPDAIDDVTSEDVMEAFVPPDGPDLCPDAGSTLIYVISEQNELMSFYPPTASFSDIGPINCPDPAGGNPFSMAVNRQGVAYVVFSSGHLFRVSTKTAACAATTFVPHPVPFQVFGMGFSANVDDAGGAGDGGETLFIAADPDYNSQPPLFPPTPSTLAVLDTASFQVRPVGRFTPSIYAPELTGTGAGQLFGFYAVQPTSSPAAIIQIEKPTADTQNPVSFPSVIQGTAWAFAFWGGDFYMFTAPSGGTTVVTRYRPSDGSVVDVATTSATIVGAGVSTCAPQM